MSRFSVDNNNFPYDNNVLVLDLVLGSLWGVPPPINWDQVAKLVPGFSPAECALRFEELKTTGAFPPLDHQQNVVSVGGGSSTNAAETEGGNAETSRSKSSISGRVVISEKKEKRVTIEDEGKTANTKDPHMVIHVCDETKSLRQDFTCPRELLVKEMRYFSEYLSVDAQRWDEVDISVHCDVQIFDWLMNYVRRNSGGDGAKNKPKLEPSNVISILISSEFLKMDALVEECVQYCHKHMSAIVATPCNMNCINAALASRIAEQFSHNEADDIRDKKDKFKSKLFQKKVERLFDPQRNPDSPGNASTLYRCGLCLKLLTRDTERRISCVPGKINVDRRGDIIYTHSRQKSWDANEFLAELFEELKSWVLVYWRLWGTVNHLSCSRCQQLFMCCELTHCRYHPDSVQYVGPGSEKSRQGAGVFPCCGQRVLRFDPTAVPKGCRRRDHIVSLSDGDQVQTRVLNDLLLHRDAVCVSERETGTGEETTEREAEVLSEPTLVGPSRADGDTFSLLKNWSLQLKQASPLSEDDDCTTGSEVTEDEVAHEEELNRKQSVKKAKKPPRPLRKQLSSPNFSRREKSERDAFVTVGSAFTLSVQKSKWDSSRSLRYNQDAQREEDQRRMAEIVSHLTRMRFGDQDQSRTKDPQEPLGGIYSRLENQFRNSLQQRPNQEKTPRSKVRYAQVRNT